MSKINKYLIIGIIMIIVAIIFVVYAFNNPQKSFNININMLYIAYALYLIIAIIMIILGIKNSRK